MASAVANNYSDASYTAVTLKHPDHSSEENTPLPYTASLRYEDSRGVDSFSLHSRAPLAQNAVAPPSMPVAQPARPGAHRHGASSWDILNGIRKDFEGFDPRNATEAHLQFAQGDMPNNLFTKIYHYLLNVSIVTRWTLFIVPILALLWIPGILGLTEFPDAKVWNVKLLWWSIWLSVVWAGWWASLAGSRLLPGILRNTIGLVAVGSRKYIDWLSALTRYVALFGWTLAIWISFNPLIVIRSEGDESAEVSFLVNLLFGSVLCAGLLLFEKFSIQWIAGKFHERSYAERIADQKMAVKILVLLYSHSSELPGRSDTLKDRDAQKQPADPRKLIKKALKGVRAAATTTTTALGNVASEIAGSSVLQPNSPQAVVQTALRSANKTRLLARRLFYSFCQPGQDSLVLTDIAPHFQNYEMTQTAFALFDKDGNGDVTREELELACLEIHREQLSIEHSMQDLDSAVGRLDNIFMSLYVIIAILIMVVILDRSVASLITGAGTIILGLSWLIGDSLAEVLASIIFLFIKHPFDVGDRITVEKETYTVKEIRLLSTIFLDKNSCLVQAPNSVLTTQFIHNYRRSPQMSEPFEFDVAYNTSFEQIERLREKMLAFVKSEGRDFLPSFDIIVKDIPDQEKMSLSADIKYKSNWQQGAMKVKRRNKWVCALKTSLHELGIYGPSGNPKKELSPTVITKQPWNEYKLSEAEKIMREGGSPSPFRHEYNFSDRSAAVMSDGVVFGESEQMYMSNSRVAFVDSPQSPYSATSPFGPTPMPSMPSMPSSSGTVPSYSGMPTPTPPMPTASPQEEYEMSSGLSQRRPTDPSSQV